MSFEKIKLLLLIIIAGLTFDMWWTSEIDPILRPEKQATAGSDNMQRYLMAEMSALTVTFKTACETNNPLVIVPAYQLYRSRFGVLRTYLLSKNDDKYNFLIKSVDDFGEYYYTDDTANASGCKAKVKVIEDELNALLQNIDK